MVAATAYPEVDQVLDELLAGARRTLGKRFVGMYLYGSLALGDFDPHSSDIDFVVVTEEELSDRDVAALAAMHARIAASYPRWARELEGSYIPRRDLRRYDPARARHPHSFEGHVEFEQHGVHWVIERHVLREHGVVLAGPDPRTLIDPVDPAELRQAVVDLVRSWWAPMIADPARLYDPKYQKYAVVTMCRVLYTLEHGAVVSKPTAVRWARGALEQRWQAVIERTLAGQADQVNQVRDFLRFTVGAGAEKRG